jgi:hypothetical protein
MAGYDFSVVSEVLGMVEKCAEYWISSPMALSMEQALTPPSNNSLISPNKVSIFSVFVSLNFISMYCQTAYASFHSIAFCKLRGSSILKPGLMALSAWQLMTPSVGGTIDNTFFQRYDATVQTALNSGSDPYVILDLVSLSSLQDFAPNPSSITMPAGTVKLSTKAAPPMTNTQASGPSLRLNTKITIRSS